MSEMAAMVCGECGIEFHVPARWHAAKREDHSDFYCPNGHCRRYVAESEKDKLRRRAERAEQEQARLAEEAQQERESRQAVERRLSATQGVVTKFRRRASNGVCPCCTRSFSDLRRHMETKHPQFAAEAS